MKILNSKRWSKTGAYTHIIAIFGVFVAFCIRFSLHNFLQGNIPMTFFIMNTIIIALFFGYLPSLVTIFFSIPLAFFFFVPPFDSFDTPTPQDGFVFCSYIMIALIAVAVIEWLQRERYKTELMRRVANSNFQLLSEVSYSLKMVKNQVS